MGKGKNQSFTSVSKHAKVNLQGVLYLINGYPGNNQFNHIIMLHICKANWHSLDNLLKM